MQESLSADFGLSELPIQRLPRIRALRYFISTARSSTWVVEVNRQQLAVDYKIVCEDETYDPLVGWKYEWWGYDHQ